MNNKSQRKSNAVYWGVPAFIVIYFVFAFYPIVANTNKEIIPFSVFRLYSRIPNSFTHYDFLITDRLGDSSFLFYNNKQLSKVERKYYLTWLSRLGDTYATDGYTDVDSNHFVMKEIEGKVEFVKMEGDYLDLYRKGEYELESLKEIK